jgi:hypothetical protein
MTSPIAIRGFEQWNRWSTDHSPLLKSEDTEGRRGSRMLGGGIRLLPVVRYGFILLALCLLLSDTIHLAFAASSNQNADLNTQSARNARTAHGIPPARQTAAKRHSGV